MNQQPLVHIVDDEEDMRESLRMLLESVGIDAVGHPSVDQFLTAYEINGDSERPGCLLLDVRMPGMSGMALLERLHEQRARLPVIMLTGHGDISMAVNAMKLGAADFVTKPVNHQQLIERIQEVLRNPTLHDGSTVTGMDPLEAEERWNTLTPREKDICARIAKGASNKMVAYSLGISVRTVESHRAHIMEKLHARSLVDLVQLSLSLRQPL